MARTVGTRAELRARRAALYAEWQALGRNGAELARRHGLAKMTVSRLIRRAAVEAAGSSVEPIRPEAYKRRRTRPLPRDNRRIAELMHKWKPPTN